jgi:hypothetical protein
VVVAIGVEAARRREDDRLAGAQVESGAVERAVDVTAIQPAE